MSQEKLSLDNLTPQEKELMQQISDEYVRYIKDAVPTDEEAVRQGLKDLSIMIKEELPRVEFVDSPIALVYLVEAMKACPDEYPTDENMAACRAQAAEWQAQHLRDGKPPIAVTYFIESRSHDIGDFGWVAFYDFFDRIGKLDNEDFRKVRGLVRDGRPFITAWFEKMIVLVCKMPVEIHLDDQSRLHNPDGPAIRFADGYEEYVWHGTFMPRAVIMEPDTIEGSRYLAITNLEERRAWTEALGGERVARIVGKTVIDTDTDHQQTVVLWKTASPLLTDDEGVDIYGWYVDVTCPSTGRGYSIGVRPGFTSAWEALCSTFPAIEVYQPDVEA